MSGTMNRVILVGRLGAAPQRKDLPQGKVVTEFPVATDRGYKSDGTDWHRIKAYGNLAETCARYLEKGQSCIIQGRLSYRKWEKAGETRYSTDIIAERVEFLSKPSRANNNHYQAAV